MCGSRRSRYAKSDLAGSVAAALRQAQFRSLGGFAGGRRPHPILTLCTLCTTITFVSKAYVSGRVSARYERLVTKQARAAKTSKSNLVARYVIEKSLETEFPGISFRDSLSGREAHLTGHRVAVWEVLAVHGETKSVKKTADHFRWPLVLVKRALAYTKAFPEETRKSREGETDAAPFIG